MKRQNLVPVALQERIQTIDIIRGVALFGILIINFTVDHRALNLWTEKPLIDQFVYWPITLLIDDRFRAIYSFLFGLGFSIQMFRAEARNSSFVLVYMRRLIVLYLIGVANQIFTHGDILQSYAMVGVILLLLHKLPRKFLLPLALICFFIGWSYIYFFREQTKPAVVNSNRTTITVDTSLLNTYVGVYEIEPGRRVIITTEGNKLFGEGRGGRVEWLSESQRDFFFRANNARFSFMKDSADSITSITMHMADGVTRIAHRIKMEIPQAQKEMIQQRIDFAKKQKAPTYKEFIIKNANEFWAGLKNWSAKRFFLGPAIGETLPLFLMGLYFGRRRIFYNIPSNKRFLQQVMKWCLSIGMTGVTISTAFSAWEYFNNVNSDVHSQLTNALVYGLGWNLGVMITAIGIIAGMALLFEKIDWKKRLSFFAPVGRMGLTNYLLHLAAATMILNYGLKLTTLGVFGRFILSLPVFVLLVLLSRWWFRHFRIGPAEWLWRSLTYLKIQPMRLKQTDKEKENGNI